MKPKMPRAKEIDLVRGIAIIMMIIFHFAWSLRYLGVIDVVLYKGFWSFFQKTTASLFIFIVGVSLTISYSRTIDKTPERYPLKFLARGLRIFSYGMIITLVSWLWKPNEFVFFGILHLIGTSVIIATPFIDFKWLNMVIGAALIGIGIYLKKFIFSFAWLVWLGFIHPVSTLDLYPVLPWAGLVFIGIAIGNLAYPKGKRSFKLSVPSWLDKTTSPIQFLGRNALAIYFIHLPIAYFAAFLVSSAVI